MTEPSESRPEVLVAGETLIDFLPEQPGPLAGVETFTRRAGGAAANVAIGLARLDVAPWFLTNVSEDGFGDFLARTLAENEVPGKFVARDADHDTTLAFVTHDERADRSFTFYGSDTTARYLAVDKVRADTLAACSWVCIDGPVALAAEPARSELLALCERAREQGCQVAFDPNTRRELWPDAKTFVETVETVLAHTDVVTAAAEDFGDTPFAADDPEVLAESLFEAGAHTVFLTRGAGGAHAIAAENAPWGPASLTHSGYAVEPVDTTGAGDAFLAGVLAAFADTDDDREADLKGMLGFANAVAALTTTETGAIAALPDREAVADLRSWESR